MEGKRDVEPAAVTTGDGELWARWDGSTHWLPTMVGSGSTRLMGAAFYWQRSRRCRDSTVYEGGTVLAGSNCNKLTALITLAAGATLLPWREPSHAHTPAGLPATPSNRSWKPSQPSCNPTCKLCSFFSVSLSHFSSLQRSPH